MVRTISYDKNGLKKGSWSQEEDDKLRAFIQSHGHRNWLKLPRFAGLSRTGKSCRLRWVNYLGPNIRRGNYTQEEDELIIKLHNELGKKWCVIASKLPGRTDNEIKNHWHTKLKKRRTQNTTTSDQYIETSEFVPKHNKKVEHKTEFVDDASFHILESSQVSLEPYSSSEASSLSSDHALSSDVSLAEVDIFVSSDDSFSEFSDDFWTELFLANSDDQNDLPWTLTEEGFTYPFDLVELLY